MMRSKRLRERTGIYLKWLHATLAAGDDCNTYVDNIDLRPDEKEVLLAWLDGGAPEGEPTDASASSSSLETAPFVADIAVALPEAYTPSPENQTITVVSSSLGLRKRLGMSPGSASSPTSVPLCIIRLCL